MTPEQWQRAAGLFNEVVALPPAAQRRFLESRCPGDAGLRAVVEQLIACDRRTDFIDTPALTQASLTGADQPSPLDPFIGRTVGAYRLVERIATGGMGIVYRGVRVDESFALQVAVKLVGSEVDSAALLERFCTERRTLAALAHPNIARLLDGGTTDDGMPYLVMELIRGCPIDTYCDEHRLSIAERLELFATVCRAVHFAHQNLVVHRDLKPSNILVDEEGVPKLLDFGIARVLDPDDREAARATRTESRLLTPDYASPEQMSGAAVTTASDVYSLGVVLFGLVTGRRPYRLKSSRLRDIEEAICDLEPRAPSVALGEEHDGAAPPAEIAARRGMTPERLRRRLRGDLDTIVLMALRKDPGRRYASAEHLAADIERSLRRLPVHARRDTLLHRGWLFVRRHRVGVAAALVMLLVIVAGSVATAMMARRAVAERDLARSAERRAEQEAVHARIEAETSHEITRLLLETFIVPAGGPSPVESAAVLTRLDEELNRIRTRYAEQPHLRANLIDAVGRACCSAGLFGPAQALIDDAAELRRVTFGADSVEFALSLESQGKLALARGDSAAAADRFAEALAIHRTAPRGVHTDVPGAIMRLADALVRDGRSDEAARLLREAIEIRAAEPAPDRPAIAELAARLAEALDRPGPFHRAAPLRRRPHAGPPDRR
ncbi:MAG: serine/threonine-protein kinase [Planctomycetota bacterium]